MKIAVIGGPGTVGTGIVNLLKDKHEILSIGKTRGDYKVDLLDPDSIKDLFADIDELDGVISTVGNGRMAPLLDLDPEDFEFAFNSKLIGNFNLVKEAAGRLNQKGFIILTSGIASMAPIAAGASLSVACAALEAFVRSSAVEDTHGIRINAVSPGLVKETMELFGLDSGPGISSADTARVYQHLIDNPSHGTILNVPEYLKSLNQQL